MTDKIIRLFILLVILIIPLQSCEGEEFVDSSCQPHSKIVEGWCLHNSLRFSGLLPCEIDCSTIHAEMAELVDKTFQAQNACVNSEDAGSKCTAIIRFQFLYENGETITVGLSIDGAKMATMEELPPTNELVFVSGKMLHPPPKGGYGSRPLNSFMGRTIGSVFCQCLFGRYLMRFLTCKRDDLPHEVVKQDIERRWNIKEDSFLCPSIQNIQELHSRTYQLLCKWPSLNNKRKRIDEIENHATAAEKKEEEKQKTTGQDQFEVVLVDNVDTLVQRDLEKPKIKVVKDLGKKIAEIQKNPDSVFRNPEVNNYTCAEQTMMAFLEDRNVVASLKSFMIRNSTNPIKAVIVHVCSYFSPCHHCATSWIRESEPGGVLSLIFDRGPVRLVTSCLQAYDRKGKEIPYEKVDFEKPKEWDFPIFPYPYPLVLLDPPSLFAVQNNLDIVRRGFASEQEVTSGKKAAKQTKSTDIPSS